MSSVALASNATLFEHFCSRRHTGYSYGDAQALVEGTRPAAGTSITWRPGASREAFGSGVGHVHLVRAFGLRDIMRIVAACPSLHRISCAPSLRRCLGKETLRYLEEQGIAVALIHANMVG
jgi:hypothetical protein